MATLVDAKWATNTGADPASITLDASLTSGQLAVGIGMERSGGSATNHAISTGSWARPIARTIEQANGTFRRTFSMSYLVSNGTEGDTFSLDDGTGNNKWFEMLVFDLAGEENTFTLLDSASNDNGTTADATSIATGNTGSITGQNVLIVTGCSKKNGVIGVSVDSSWGSMTTGIQEGNQSNGMFGSMGYLSGTVSTGAQSDTWTLDTGSTANNGLAAGILVFQLESGGGGGGGAGKLSKSILNHSILTNSLLVA